MKNLGLVKLIMVIAMSVIGIVGINAKKTLKITVIPSDAQISVDGNYVGDGVVVVTLDK